MMRFQTEHIKYIIENYDIKKIHEIKDNNPSTKRKELLEDFKTYVISLDRKLKLKRILK